MSINVCPDDIFWILKHFITKLGMVMHHYVPNFQAQKLVCYIQDLGHSEGSYVWNMTVPTKPFELLIPLQLNLVLWHLIISQSVLWKKMDCCVQGQCHSKSQNVNVCLSGWYLLNCWTIYLQTWYGDASLWARVSCEKVGLLSSRPRSQWRLTEFKYSFLVHLLNHLSFCN